MNAQPLVPPGSETATAGVSLVVVVVLLLLAFRIVRRTGHSGWWALTALVPVANLVVLVWLAYSEWPVHRELAALRRYAAETGMPGYDPPR